MRHVLSHQSVPPGLGRNRLIAAAALTLAGCGVADTVALLQRPEPKGGAPDGGVTTVPMSLDGWWMRPMIGDCVDAEDWLHFDVGRGGFEHRIVDRNACGPHRVLVSALNSLELLGAGTVRRGWTDPDGSTTRSDDTFVTAPAQPIPAGALPHGEKAGHRELAFFALHEEAPLRFTMSHDLVLQSGESDFEVHDLATVKLDRLEPAKAPHPAVMRVHLETQQRSGMEPLVRGTAELELPVTVRLDARGTTVIADGFDEPGNDLWNQAFTDAGLWSQPGANELFRMFRPVLRLSHGLERSLYMEQETYREMLSPPPDRVD